MDWVGLRPLQASRGIQTRRDGEWVLRQGHCTQGQAGRRSEAKVSLRETPSQRWEEGFVGMVPRVKRLLCEPGAQGPGPGSACGWEPAGGAWGAAEQDT